MEVGKGRDDPGTGPALKQFDNGPPASGTEFDGETVHIHLNEPISLCGIQAAAELAGIRECLRPVRQGVLNTRLQVSGDFCHEYRAEVAAHNVAAEREGEATLAGARLPEGVLLLAESEELAAPARRAAGAADSA